METTQATHQTARTRKNKTANKVPLPKTSRHLANYLEWLAHPTTRNIKNVPQHYSRDAFFKDPFTEVYTALEIQKYYDHTLAKLTDMHFVFENIIEEDRQAFVAWTMTARVMGR